MSSVKKNFMYNIAYQLLTLIIPLIITPYVSRVLGADGIGVYSYTYSIAYYFVIIAMLGLNNYGNRTIAKVRDNKDNLSRTFKEIYLMQLITSAIVIIAYIGYLTVIRPEYYGVSWAQTLYVVSALFDINWFFFGIEQFKLTVIRSSIVKILSLVAIFLFVKTPNDIVIYTMILAGSALTSQLLLWPFIKKSVVNVKVTMRSILKHFKPCLILFLPVIAVTVYRIIDKIMLGLMSDISEVGFYESAEKIINIPFVFITALGTVMLPRMSNMFQKNDERGSKNIIRTSMLAMEFMAFMMMFGLICISQNFSTIYFGSGFEKTGLIIALLSVTIPIFAWGNVVRTQYLIPKEMDREYIISAFLGAGANLVSNLIFIPKFQAVGACFGTILAEFIVTVYQTMAVRKKLPIMSYMKDVAPFFVTSAITSAVIVIFNFLPMSGIFRIASQIMSAVLIYGILNYKFIYDTAFERIAVFSRIKRKIKMYHNGKGLEDDPNERG